MQVARYEIFHDGGSGRIETSPLICWTGFCIIGTSVMKVQDTSSSTYTESLFLNVVKHNFLFLFFFFFFSTWVYLHEYSRFTGQQVKEESISLYPFYHFHPLHNHLYISWVIVGERSILRTAGSRHRTWNLWYTLFRIHLFYTYTGSCCC